MRRGTYARWSPSAPPPLVIAAGALVCVLGLGGCAAGTGETAGAAAAPTAVAPVSPSIAPSPASSPSPSVITLPAADTAPVADLRPVRLSVPALKLDVELDDLGLDKTGKLARPARSEVPGWFAGGVVPGEIGPAVIAGHVDSVDGPAVFWKLRDLAPGDEVTVTRSDGTTAKFRVTASEQFPQKSFPTQKIYGPTPDSQLRLITCDGTYDRKARHYRDNRVVFAVAI